MKNCILIIISCFFVQHINAQNYWKTYRMNDGLPSNKILGITFHQDKTYLASDSGLTIFQNGVFTNYKPPINQSSNFKRIRNFNDTIWMISDSGLTQFYNGTFQFFSDKNGLITNKITDIEVNSRGDLWISSGSGLVIKKGNNFIYDSSKVIFDLGINSGDSVYARTHHSLYTSGAFPFPTCELFDGQTWKPLIDKTSHHVITEAQFITLSNGKLGITSSNSGVYLIDSVFKVTKYNPVSYNSIYFQRVFDIGSDSSLWIGCNNQKYPVNFLELGVQKMKSSTVQSYNLGLPNLDINEVKCRNSKVLLASNNGFAIADEAIVPLKMDYPISTSSIATQVSAKNLLFKDNKFNYSRSDFQFPKGSNNNYITSSSLWVSAISNGKTLVSYLDLGTGDFIPGPINRSNFLTRSNIYKISKSEIDEHLQNRKNPGYIIPDAIRNWPAKGNVEEGEAEDQAPFYDVDNDQCYDPENGDFPFIIGDTAIYLIYNDGGDFMPYYKTPSLGLEFHVMVSVFNQPNLKHIDQSIFVRYTIVNRSNRNYNKLKIGIGNIFSILFGNETYIGCEPKSNLNYSYSRNPTNSTLGNKIPAVGMKIINDTLDKFIAFNNEPNQSLDFLDKNDYIKALNGLWNDSSKLAYGGNGYKPSATQFSNHIFPGDIRKPVEWSQVNTGSGSVGQESYRTQLSILPAVNLKQGDRKTIDLVYGIGFDSSNTDYIDNINLLIDNLNLAGNFQKGVVSILPDYTYSNCITGLEENSKTSKKPQISLYPNPTSGELNVLSLEKIEGIKVFDVQARLVQNVELSSSNILQSISLKKQIPNGIYFIQVITESKHVFSEKFILNH